MDDEAAPVIDSFASVGDVFGGPLVTSFLDAAVAVFEGAGGCRGKRLATDDSRFSSAHLHRQITDQSAMLPLTGCEELSCGKLTTGGLLDGGG
jgi:hypothetical protein